MKMRKIILFCVLFFLIEGILAEVALFKGDIEIQQGDKKEVSRIDSFVYYKINLKYDKGIVTIDSIREEQVIEAPDSHGSYNLEISNKDGILDSINFEVPNIIIYDIIDSESKQAFSGGLFILNETSFDVYVPYDENAEEIVIYDKDRNKIARGKIKDYLIDEETPMKNNLWLLGVIILLLITLIVFNKKSKKKRGKK